MTGERVPVKIWTDDEWLASMAHFPPETDIAVCERWIAEQRIEAHRAAEKHRKAGGK